MLVFLKLIKLVAVSAVFAMLVGCGSDNESKKDNTEEILADDVAIVVGSQELTATQIEIMNLHNEKRKNHYNGSDLSYSIELENEAKRYANILANSGKFEHDPTNGEKGYGENLDASSENRKRTIVDAMYNWYDEERPYYVYDSGTCIEAYYPKDKNNGGRIGCGHYTQVIWQESREVGCATAQYKKGVMKGGFVYVCKYKKAGNSSMNGEDEKPYCKNYNNSDIYLDNIPSNLALAGKSFDIELREEDRITCATPVDRFNSAIEFSADLKSAKIKEFQIFNNDEYPNSLEFNSVHIDGKTVSMIGINKNIRDEKYKNKKIYMNLTIIGESTDYYSVEIEWNGLDASLLEYARTMKAKLHK